MAETRLRRPQWRRLLRPALMVAGLVVVFAWLLPKFIDYDEVWQALTRLDALEIVALSALALLRIPSEAMIYRAFLPGLGLWRGSKAYLSSNFAGQLLPPPTPSVVQYGYFRGAGYETDTAQIAAAGSFLFPTIGRMLLPVAALALLLMTGEVTGAIVGAAVLSVIVTSIAAGVASFFLRAERYARWLGAKTQRPLSWILVKLKREPIEDGAGSAAAFRRRALALLRQGWRLGAVGVALNLLLTYLILLAALRFVDVSTSSISASQVFAAFAVAFWAGAVIPITGSGLGVVDAVLIAALVELSDASDDTLLAAALLWRVFYSLITLPLGAITFSRYRKASPDGLEASAMDTPSRASA